MTYEEEYINSVLNMFDEVLGEAGNDDKAVKALPYQILNIPDKTGWFLDPIARKMVMAHNNIEVVQISRPDENNKILVKTPTGYLYVPQSFVEDVGFN